MNEFFQNWDMPRVYKWGTIVLMMLALFLGLKAISVLKDIGDPNPVFNTISVSGTGESTTVANIATFSFSVSQDSKNVADAQKTVTDKINAILAGLKDLNVEDRDIKTADYNVYPKYVYEQTTCAVGVPCVPGRSIPDGYTVSQSVTVKIRKTDDAGKALALVGEKGATNISSLSLTLDEPDMPMNEARAKAIDNAKAKAEELARHLGVRLVRVVSFYDNTPQGPYPIYAYDKAMGMGGATEAAAAPRIPLGENKTVSNVTVTYEIR